MRTAIATGKIVHKPRIISQVVPYIFSKVTRIIQNASDAEAISGIIKTGVPPMKRSPMKRGTSQMKRGTPLRNKKPLQARSSPRNTSSFKSTATLKSTGRIKTTGKKTDEWIKVREQLEIEFLAMGITSCELGYEDCWRDKTCAFAHAKKRRYLKPEELTEVILACSSCHNKIEYLPKEYLPPDERQMAKIVRAVIAARKARQMINKA